MPSSADEIKKRLEQNWISYLSRNSQKLGSARIDGASPPAVFVGRHGYPKVNIGPLIPPDHGDTTVLDRPEMWTGKSLEEIAGLRLRLVRGMTAVSVQDTSSRMVRDLHELAMARRPVEAEATFERQPLSPADMGPGGVDSEPAPYGLAAPLKEFKASSSAADQRIESAYYDTDLSASDAVVDLYRRGVQTSTIQRVLSIGMLGRTNSRKLVPTRWSITATDDAISRAILQEIQLYPSIDSYEITEFVHLANRYSVILIPDDVWSFEMVESWFTSAGETAIASDYESARGLDHYPSIAGAYFAARLAVVEHLSARRRKAAALVLREIYPEYVMPLGVWQIREGVREALKNRPVSADSLEQAIAIASNHTSLSKAEIMGRSMLRKALQGQSRITDFA